MARLSRASGTAALGPRRARPALVGPTTGARCLDCSLRRGRRGRPGLLLDGRLSCDLACQPGDFYRHTPVPRMGTKQPNVQTPIVGVRSTPDCLDHAGPAARHSPSRYRCDALLHLRPPRRGARPPTLGSARPHVGLDRCGRGRAGACRPSAASPRLGRHVPRGDVGVADGHGRGRRPDPGLGLDLKPRPAPSLRRPRLPAVRTRPDRSVGRGPNRHAARPRHGARARDGRRADAPVTPGEALVRRRACRTARAADRPARPRLDSTLDSGACGGGGGVRAQGDRWSDFDLRTNNQAITWLKTNRHPNKMYVRWLDGIEDFRLHVTHLPGSCNPSDPLSRRGFPGSLPRRRRPCRVDGRPRRGEPEGALLSARSGRHCLRAGGGPAGRRALARRGRGGTLLGTERRSPRAVDARHRPRQVGSHTARGGGDVRQHPGGGCNPLHPRPRGGGPIPPVY